MLCLERQHPLRDAGAEVFQFVEASRAGEQVVKQHALPFAADDL